MATLPFKCLSKLFQTLISSPSFTNLHLQQSLSSNTNRLLIAVIDSGPHLIDLDSPENSPLLLPIPAYFGPNHRFLIAGSCNGLLLIFGTDKSLWTINALLMNPATGFSSVIRPGLYFDDGFGYDDVASDYKFYRFTKANLLIKKLNDGRWEIGASPLENLSIYMDRSISCHVVAVFNDHLCHWLLWSRSGKKYQIMCFDLCSETWIEDVPLPEFDDSGSETPRSNHGYVTNLRVFEGCLSVSTVSSGHAGLDVWIMKSYGVAGSWVKLFSVPERLFSPIAYAKGSNSKVLLRSGRHKEPGKLIWYDIRNKQCEKAETHDIHGVRGASHVYDVCVLKGSLVTVPNIEP